MRIRFVSSLPPTLSGGGNFVVGTGLFRALEALGEAVTWLELDTSARSLDVMVSKWNRRIFRRPAAVAQSTQATLERTAARLEVALSSNSEIPLFKGVTPWVAWMGRRPYFVYTDVAFATLLENQGLRNSFRRNDLERIFRQERRFLAGSRAVFFESAWGLEQTRQSYELKGLNFHMIGRASLFEPEPNSLNAPPKDHPSLLFVAKHFEQKGGDLVYGAFRLLRRSHPDLQWNIVGGLPSFRWKRTPGVRYHGFLRPDVPDELETYRSLYRRASLLVHPTREDTNPLVITEAGCFACPCVSVRRFAIPELVDDGASGILLPWPVRAEILASRIAGLLDDPIRNEAMRRSALAKAWENGSWLDIARRARDIMSRCLESDQALPE